MDQISDEVKSMEEQHKSLKSGNASLLRVNSHRASCTSFSRVSCNCNRGALTFSEINDVESQLLNTGTAVKTKSIQRVGPKTSIGLGNFSRVFLTPSAIDSLDAARFLTPSAVDALDTAKWHTTRLKRAIKPYPEIFLV